MEELRELRENGSRADAGRTVRIGVDLLRKRSFALGSEQWSIREQVFVAALDANELEVCASTLKELKAQFPSSQRVGRLEGLLLEAQGKTKDAAAVYAKILEENKGNMVAMKRKICLLKSTGKLNEAIKQLTLYLDEFQADAEGWAELARMYVEAGSIQNACFCLEEILLSQPHSYLSFLAYAEALFTLGGSKETYFQARSYFAQSLIIKKTPYNLRAAWGLAVTTKGIDGILDAPAEDVGVQHNKALNKRVLDEISNTTFAPGMDEIVKAAARKFSVA
mmetsp:Transcript_17570/g.30979  ORF Transcript_17570/g.30979 Transcript_17570/m.30979 type:complete len:279 (-) Transcript_17570:74-910(-)